MKTGKVIFLAVNALIVAALVYFVARLDFAHIGTLLRQASAAMLIFGLFTYLFSLYAKILRLDFVLRYFGRRLSFWDTAYVQMVGIALAMMTPGRLGEASKIYLLHQHNIPGVVGMAATIYERLFDVLFLGVASVTLGLLFLPSGRWVWAFIGLTALVALLLAGFRFLHRVTRWIPARWQPFFLALQQIPRTHRVRWSLLTALSTIATWGSQALLSWAILRALGQTVSPVAVIGIEAVGTLAGIFSFLPLGLGAMDLSMLVLYTQLGVDREIAALTILASRALGFGAPLVIGLVMANARGLSFTDIRRGTKQTPATPAAPLTE